MGVLEPQTNHGACQGQESKAVWQLLQTGKGPNSETDIPPLGVAFEMLCSPRLSFLPKAVVYFNCKL